MNEYKIKFTAIELIAKTIAEPPGDLKPKESFTGNFFVDIRLDPERKIAATIVTSNIILERTNAEVANFKILCVFELPDFNEIFRKNIDKQYETPVELEIILKSTGISTLRGIIASEVKGTYLQGFVLPLIDINSLVRNQREQMTSG